MPSEAEPFLLDTNILVYAYACTQEDAGTPAEARKLTSKMKKCRSLLSAALKGELSACVASQNIAEFYAVATSQVARPIETAQAAMIARALATSSALRMILETDESFREVFAWIEAGKREPDRGAWIHDCRLAFSAKANGIRTILSENVGDFADFDFIKVINPLDPAFEIPKPERKTC